MLLYFKLGGRMTFARLLQRAKSVSSNTVPTHSVDCEGEGNFWRLALRKQETAAARWLRNKIDLQKWFLCVSW